ncbi:MAG: 3-phosphoshikimate 1-carboxyvinyltransferase [Hungatella sp.]|nr:3-phosphoshikimate 1-carboxyvinyltransferase [Hungatella sp.]
MIARVTPKMLKGHAMVPGSKSHTIRAILLAAMAEGTSRIHNPLPSLDCKSAMKAAELFGAQTNMEDRVWTVTGTGGKIKVPDNYLDCGNSGSVAYFAAPMAALCDGYTFITGDVQIRRRPMGETLSAICQLGGEAFPSRPGSGSCPAIVRGRMRGGIARFEGTLSQVVSGIMMAAPLLEEDTEIFIKNPKEKPYLQLTLDWMLRYGILVENKEDYRHFVIRGGRSYRKADTVVASDWSGVAFPLVAAVITDSEVVIDAVDFQDSQGDKAVVDCLIAMGADITRDLEAGTLAVKGGREMKSEVSIDLRDIPDSLPALSVAAAFARGDTRFTGLEHVRLKETDRVAVMEQELGKMGADVETGPDYMTVHGGKRLTGTVVDSHGDHRVAMALTVCGLWAKGTTLVKGAQCAAVSFPDFFKVMNRLGAGIEILEDGV